MDGKKLLEVCFSWAEDLMWTKDTAPIEKLPEHISEFREMTDTFMMIAIRHYYQLKQLADGQEILLGAIRYLNAQAIPLLRANYAWNTQSLSTLLDIVEKPVSTERFH